MIDTGRIIFPQEFGPYNLLGIFTSDSKSAVYFAELRGRGKAVLIKRLHTELSSDKGKRADFRLDADKRIQLVHPNITPVLEIGEIDEEPYIAMEHSNESVTLGIILTNFINNYQCLPEQYALYIISQILRALRYIHLATDNENRAFNNPVHNLAANNITVALNGEIKLLVLDTTSSSDPSLLNPVEGSIVVSRYSAPELILSLEKIDHRSSIYSVGAILFELLTGRSLINSNMHENNATNPVIKRRMFRNLHPLPSDVNNKLSKYDHLIDTVLQYDPDKRFQSADIFLDNINQKQVEMGSICSADSLAAYLAEYKANIPTIQNAINNSSRIEQITQIS